jgi:hypothetical protein
LNLILSESECELLVKSIDAKLDKNVCDIKALWEKSPTCYNSKDYIHKAKQHKDLKNEIETLIGLKDKIMRG